VQLAQEAAKETAPEVTKETPASPAANAEPVASSNATVDTVPTEAVPVASNTQDRTDQTLVTLASNEATEVKMQMREGAKVEFSWSVQGGVVNFDTHGDKPGVDYHGYGKGKGAAGDHGVLEVAFDGNHGWFWRNRGTEPVTVTLKTKGEYLAIKKML
jgi:hypothetical protein